MVVINGIETSINPRDLELYFTDYLHKLEVDDFDPQAVRKMRDIRELLEELQEVMQDD